MWPTIFLTTAATIAAKDRDIEQSLKLTIMNTLHEFFYYKTFVHENKA